MTVRDQRARLPHVGLARVRLLMTTAMNMDATLAEDDEEKHMRELYRFTARTLKTAHPVPFGALIVTRARASA